MFSPHPFGPFTPQSGPRCPTIEPPLRCNRSRFAPQRSPHCTTTGLSLHRNAAPFGQRSMVTFSKPPDYQQLAKAASKLENLGLDTALAEKKRIMAHFRPIPGSAFPHCFSLNYKFKFLMSCFHNESNALSSAALLVHKDYYSKLNFKLKNTMQS